MKKLLIATAAMAVVAGAQAQSSVTVYGVLDVNYSSVDTGALTNSAQSGGTLATSRLGFKGTEDLGSGNKAEFQLESQLDPTTGKVGSDASSVSTKIAGQTFNRESWVGLSSATLGSVRIGTTDVTDSANIDAITSQAGNLGLIQATNANNAQKSIRYTTPTFAGISAQVGYANAGAATTAETTLNKIGSAFVKYEAGSLGLYAGVEETKKEINYNQKQTIFGAKYDFGFASVGATYATLSGTTAATKKSADLDQTRVSIAAPVSALGTGVKAHLVYFKDATGAAADAAVTGNYLLADVKPADGYKVALTKAFSKRTTGYVGFVDTDYKKSTEADSKTYVVGVAHTF